MKRTITPKTVITTLLLLMMTWLLNGCIFSSESQKARTVAEQFWTAVQEHDTEKTKNLATYNSIQYLRFLNNEKFTVQRFETGEVKIEANGAEVATVLYSGKKGNVSIPLRTVLVYTDKDGWRINVKNTMGSMVSGTVGAAVEELNKFMQEGLKGLDKSLSKNLNDLGKSLQDNLEELQKKLEQQK